MSVRRQVAALVACGAFALCSGCVTGTWETVSVEQPITDAQLQDLPPGTDLGVVLARLGAPHVVFEYAGDGVAIGYVHTDASGWGVTASYSFERYVSARFEGDWGATDLPGVVLWFDAELHLLEWSRGLMRDLTAQRRRPSYQG